MTYVGSGTRASPIAVDDSEDEVVNELYNNSTKSSPTAGNRMSLRQGAKHGPHPAPPPPTMTQLPIQTGKRKRGESITSQPGPTHGQRPHPSLANRITHPPAESKKAKKRRRKAERQAAEEARLQNVNWLNNAFAPMPPTRPLPFPPWPNAQPFYDDFMAMQSTVPFFNAPPPMYRYPYEELPYGEPLIARSPSPQPPQPPLSPPPSPPRTSDWVSSMSMASLQDREPLRPPTPQNSLPHIGRANVSDGATEQTAPSLVGRASTSALEPIEQPQHALPPKPPPVQTIGMKPDQDPNSKHGIFHISPSTKEGGTGTKNRTSAYIPNPARTLVMEQLPKSHRGTDFINKWSRSACGALPVHIFIDGQAAKALIEFATAEQARKAWASPKLGQAFNGLKPHQLKGKPREDLIKVWWYRVDGVGAGAGVGEIEEGEIEDDPAAAEHKDAADAAAPKETKKERKARLAQEREAKRLKLLALKNAREEVEEPPTEQSYLTQPESDAIESTQGLSLADIPPIYPVAADFEQETPLSSTTPTTMSNRHGVSFASRYNMPTLHPLPANPMAYQPPLAGFFSEQNPRPDQSSQHSLYPHSYGQAQWTSSSFDEATPQATVGFNGAQIDAFPQYREDDHESIASSAGRSSKPPQQSAMSMSSLYSQADDLDDYEDMDVELDDVTPPPPPATFVPSYQSLSFSQDQGWAGRSARLSASTAASNTLPNKPQTLRPQAPRHAPYPLSKPKPLPASSAMAAVFVPRHLPGQSAAARADLSAETLSTEDAVSRQRKVAAPTTSLAGLVITNSPKMSAHTAHAHLETTIPTASTPPPTSTTPTPSEPKAMKNAPTAPSFAKRALMARQKELEEKIAQSKMQLAAAAAAASDPSSETSTPFQVPTKPSVDAEDKQAMEDRLRKLVLQSRKPVTKPEAAPVITKQPEVVKLPTPSVATTSPPTVDDTSSATAGFSLEDMAVSFITEAIEAVKTLPPPPLPTQPITATPPSGLPQPSANPPLQSNIKSELAAKQKRLEEHIAETKALMEQFSQAKTKEAKDEIMKSIRERRRAAELLSFIPDFHSFVSPLFSRLFESGSPVSANSKPAIASATTATGGYQNNHGGRMTMATATTQHLQVTRWPVSHRNAGVFILSDDEDEDEDDET